MTHDFSTKPRVGREKGWIRINAVKQNLDWRLQAYRTGLSQLERLRDDKLGSVKLTIMPEKKKNSSSLRTFLAVSRDVAEYGPVDPQFFCEDGSTDLRTSLQGPNLSVQWRVEVLHEPPLPTGLQDASSQAGRQFW